MLRKHRKFPYSDLCNCFVTYNIIEYKIYVYEIHNYTHIYINVLEISFHLQLSSVGAQNILKKPEQ